MLHRHTPVARSKDQPDKVANPARGQLNRENEYLSAFFAPENLVSRDVPFRVNLLISIPRLNLVLTYGITLEFRGGVHLFIRLND